MYVRLVHKATRTPAETNPRNLVLRGVSPRYLPPPCQCEDDSRIHPLRHTNVDRSPAIEGGSTVEVKIGVQFAPRELVLESAQSPEQVEQAVTKALANEAKKPLTLVDERGRRVLVPVDKLAYVEIAEAESRRVGFAAS